MHRDGFDGFEQNRVLAGITGCRHPVGRQLYVTYFFDTSRGDVGQRLAHGHASGRRTIEYRQRCTLAHRKGFAAISREPHQRHGYIGNGRLPGSDERIARAQPAHRAIADRNQKSLVRHRGKAQYAQHRFPEIDSGKFKRRSHAPAALHVAGHFRGLAEHDVELHVDRKVVEFGVVDF